MHSENIEDIQEAVQQGRPIREHGPYRIQIGNDLLHFSPAIVSDPVPTGLQILEAAGVHPLREYSVFQLLPSNQLEGLRFDETTDLRTKQVEKFIVFHSDRSFRFELDGIVYDWGTSRIQGRVLKILAKVDSPNYGVWQEMPGHDDPQIADDAFADLTPDGVERFFTGTVRTTEGA